MDPVTAKIIIQKAIGILTDLEGTVKQLIGGVLGVLALIIIVFSLPIIILASIPAHFLGSSNQSIADKQEELIDTYMSNKVIYNELSDWVDGLIAAEESNYSDCDSISISINMDVPWQYLMAIDAVEANQDFTNVTENTIFETAKCFITISSYKEKVTLYRYKDEYDSEGEWIGTETIEWDEWYAYINVDMLPLKAVLDNKGFSSQDKDLCDEYILFLNTV